MGGGEEEDTVTGAEQGSELQGGGKAKEGAAKQLDCGGGETGFVDSILGSTDRLQEARPKD